MPTKEAEALAERVNALDGWRAELVTGGVHSSGQYRVYGPGDEKPRAGFTANAKTPVPYWRAEAELRRVGCPLPHRNYTPPKEDRMPPVTVEDKQRSAELRSVIENLLKERFDGDRQALSKAAAEALDGSEFDQFGKPGAQTPPPEIAADSLRMFLGGRDWSKKNLDRWEFIVGQLGASSNGGPDPEQSPGLLRGMVAAAIASIEAGAGGGNPAMTAFAAFAKTAEKQVKGASERDSVLALRRFLDGDEPDERFVKPWARQARVAGAISGKVPGLVVGRAAKYIEQDALLRGPSEELRRRLVERLTALGAMEFVPSWRNPSTAQRRKFVEGVVAWWTQNWPGPPPQTVERGMSWLARFVQDEGLVADEKLLGAWKQALDGLQETVRRGLGDIRPEIAVELEAPGAEPGQAEPEAGDEIGATLVRLQEELSFEKEVEADLTRERDEARAERDELKAALERKEQEAAYANERVGTLEADGTRQAETISTLRDEIEDWEKRHAAQAASIADLTRRLDERDEVPAEVTAEVAAQLDEARRLLREAEAREAALSLGVARLEERLAVEEQRYEAAKAMVRRELEARAPDQEFIREYQQMLLRLAERVDSGSREGILLRLDVLAGIDEEEAGDGD